jgi:hypothetical protein
LNLPISGLTFILLFLYLDVHNPRTKAVEGLLAIDYLGSLCILGLTLMLLLGLDFGGVVFPWSSPKVICLIVFGALMSVFFIWTEKKIAKYPLFPLRIFGSPSNMAAFLVTFFHGFVSTLSIRRSHVLTTLGLQRCRILPPIILPISEER